MHVEVQEIAEKVLQLSSEARAYLAEMLLESLDHEEDFAVSDEWRTEIRKRCREIEEGKVELIPGDQAMAALQLKFS
jgi:putative addiction module component (TIGR02574 family)